MSDKNLKIQLPLIDDIQKELIQPPANSLGRAGKDILDGVFNLALGPVRKYNIVKDKELEDFANKINNKTEEIAPENRDSSKIGLVLKSIEDSKYQLNEETMRELFSTLISNSLDKSKNSNLTPKYSEILSNMSVSEALLLHRMYNSYHQLVPSIDIHLKTSGSVGSQKITNTFLLFDDSYTNTYTLPLSLLESSNLIKFNKDTWLTHEYFQQRYDTFEQSHFKKLKEANFFGEIDPTLHTFELNKSYYSFTVFGLSFCKLVM